MASPAGSLVKIELYQILAVAQMPMVRAVRSGRMAYPHAPIRSSGSGADPRFASRTIHKDRNFGPGILIRQKTPQRLTLDTVLLREQDG